MSYELPGARGPIAIVGMSCRFPGAPDLESFWSVLRNGVETVLEYPGRRFADLDSALGPEALRAGRIASCRGGYLHGLDLFDAGFFGLSDKEAELLDPQQRLLLELTWEAMEDGGLVREKLAGSRTGVFIGQWTSDYEERIYRGRSELDIDATNGGGRYSSSGRLAYFLDLHGPVLTLDTACSSSLTAVHLACQSLWTGECEAAIAGAVNVILRPEVTFAYSAGGVLSEAGRCQFGDAAADGYVRSEGAGVVVLKPLAAAQADGDPISALIRGTSMNNGGRGGGLMVTPSPAAQEDLLRTALDRAGLSADDLDYIEAHGTGTRRGDPIELGAIGRVLASTGRRSRRCLVGSVKTNIGHTESAAGLAGLIKVVLALKHRLIPASLHFRVPNPEVAWRELPIAIPTELTTWPDHADAPRASVAAFGITGTNALAVLEGVSSRSVVQVSPPKPRLFVLSGKTPEALKGLAGNWCNWLDADAKWPERLDDLAYTAAVRRTHLEHRLACTAFSRTELAEQLALWRSGQPSNVQAGCSAPAKQRRIAFVFPGQGGQWAGMCRNLFDEEPTFWEVLQRCDAAIRKHSGLSIIDILTSPAGADGFSGRINAVQPALFGVTVALAALWRSWGVEPSAVVGHSMGECAAAAVSGALSIDDAAAVICHRSALMSAASGRGAMAVTELTLNDATRFVEEFAGGISIAACNGPSSTVLSGEPELIDRAVRQLELREIFCQRVKVDVASHSAQMDPYLAALEARLASIQPREGSVPMYSTTSGMIEDGSRVVASYWSANLRQPVLFWPAVQRLLDDGFDTFLEINPHPVLKHTLEDGIRHAGAEAVALSSMNREQSEKTGLLNAVGALHIAGHPLDFRHFYPDGTCLRMPSYAWQKKRYWIDASESWTPLQPLASTDSERETAADHLYELEWKPFATGEAAEPAGLYVIAGESDSAANEFATLFAAQGGDCVFLKRSRGSAYFAIPAGNVRSIVYFCSRDVSPEDSAGEAFEVAKLVQEIAALDTTHPPRLWLVTLGACSVPGDSLDVSVAHGAVWGLGRAVACEHPELRCVNVDLSFTASAEELTTLAKLVREGGPEEQIAVRGTRCLTARFRKMPTSPADSAIQFEEDGTYLITGGLGGIGTKLAAWLAEHGARHIALTGRHATTDGVPAVLKEWAGLQIRVFQAEVGERSQVDALLTAISREMPPLRGVFHLAGQSENALLADLDREGFERQLKGKAVGAWALHRCTEGMPLDFFVLFSSMTTSISQPGLAAYATANACMDALAHYRKSHGLPALSVQWGVWSHLGMAQSSGESVQSWEKRGLSSFRPAEALDVLEKALRTNAALTLAVRAQWTQFAQSYPSGGMPRVFLDLAGVVARHERTAAGPISLRERLLGESLGSRRRLFENQLQACLAGVLKIGVAQIDPAATMGSLGVTSLKALEFVQRLTATVGLGIPATTVFNHPTIQLLTKELARRMELPLDGNASVGTSREEPRAENTLTVAPGITEQEAIVALLGDPEGTNEQ